MMFFYHRSRENKVWRRNTYGKYNALTQPLPIDPLLTIVRNAKPKKDAILTTQWPLVLLP
jgi:hypothetical protein